MDSADRLRGAGDRVLDSRVFAILVAVGAHHQAIDTRDALRASWRSLSATSSLPWSLPVSCALPLARLAQAWLDADHCGHGVKALIRRGVYGAAAVFYMGFAAVALNAMLGSDPSGSSDQIAHDWTAWILAKPFGQ
jgi:hypothetical protein